MSEQPKEEKKTIFKYPSTENMVKSKDGTSDTQIHPRVTFISYKWTSAIPALKTTVIKPEVNPTSTTVMYLPSGFSENFGAKWGEEDMVTGAVDASLQGAGVSVMEFAQKVATTHFGGLASAAKYDLGKTAFPGQFRVFERGEPISMDFNFDLIPMNKNEAKEIVELVSNFKEKILPGFNTDGESNSYFLQFPDIWHIKFSGANGIGFPNQKSVYPDMVLTSVKAAYGGGANTALFFHDGNPTIISLALSFQSVKHSYVDRH